MLCDLRAWDFVVLRSSKGGERGVGGGNKRIGLLGLLGAG